MERTDVVVLLNIYYDIICSERRRNTNESHLFVLCVSLVDYSMLSFHCDSCTLITSIKNQPLQAMTNPGAEE